MPSPYYKKKKDSFFEKNSNFICSYQIKLYICHIKLKKEK